VLIILSAVYKFTGIFSGGYLDVLTHSIIRLFEELEGLPSASVVPANNSSYARFQMKQAYNYKTHRLNSELEFSLNDGVRGGDGTPIAPELTMQIKYTVSCLVAAGVIEYDDFDTAIINAMTTAEEFVTRHQDFRATSPTAEFDGRVVLMYMGFDSEIFYGKGDQIVTGARNEPLRVQNGGVHVRAQPGDVVLMQGAAAFDNSHAVPKMGSNFTIKNAQWYITRSDGTKCPIRICLSLRRRQHERCAPTYALRFNNALGKHVLTGRKTVDLRSFALPASALALMKSNQLVVGVIMYQRHSDLYLLAGYVKIVAVRQYASREEWLADADRHMVNPNHRFWNYDAVIKSGGQQYAYTLTDQVSFMDRETPLSEMTYLDQKDFTLVCGKAHNDLVLCRSLPALRNHDLHDRRLSSYQQVGAKATTISPLVESLAKPQVTGAWSDIFDGCDTTSYSSGNTLNVGVDPSFEALVENAYLEEPRSAVGAGVNTKPDADPEIFGRGSGKDGERHSLFMGPHGSKVRDGCDDTDDDDDVQCLSRGDFGWLQMMLSLVVGVAAVQHLTPGDYFYYIALVFAVAIYLLLTRWESILRKAAGATVFSNAMQLLFSIFTDCMSSMGLVIEKLARLGVFGHSNVLAASSFLLVVAIVLFCPLAAAHDVSISSSGAHDYYGCSSSNCEWLTTDPQVIDGSHPDVVNRMKLRSNYSQSIDMMASVVDRASWRGMEHSRAPSDDSDWPEFALKVQAQEIDDVGKACYRSLADSGAFHTVSGDGVLFQQGIDDAVIEMRGYNGASSFSQGKGPLATEAEDEHGIRRNFPIMSYYVPNLPKTICGSGHIAKERNGAWIFRPPGCVPKAFQQVCVNMTAITGTAMAQSFLLPGILIVPSGS
jgi:hypothetical protein